MMLLFSGTTSFSELDNIKRESFDGVLVGFINKSLNLSDLVIFSWSQIIKSPCLLSITP